MLKKYGMKDIMMILLLITVFIVYVFVKDIKILIIITIPLVAVNIIISLKGFILWNINSRKYINSECIKLKPRGIIYEVVIICSLLINMRLNYSDREIYLEFNYGIKMEINNIVDYIKSYQNIEGLTISFILVLIVVMYMLNLIGEIFTKTKISNEGILLSDGTFIAMEDIDEIFVERKSESKWKEVTIKTNNKEKFLYIEEDNYCDVKKIFSLYIGEKLKESL